MSYTLKLSNGKVLLTLADQQSDNVTTSVTLIGKNVNAYGTDLNDNFIRMLENFAHTTAPTSPLVGQIWFNTIEQRMYVYNSANQFKPVAGTLVAATQPIELTTGDLWIDTTAKQLKFVDNTGTVYVAGPQYDASKGKAGWVIETVTDSGNTDHTVVGLYSNGILLGILSDVAFTLRSDFVTLTGMTTVRVGFTAKGMMKFNGTATNADSINGILGVDILSKTTYVDQVMNSHLWFYNDTGISIGSDEDFQFYIGTNRVATLALGAVQDFDLVLKTNTDPEVHGLYWDSTTGCLGIFNNTPTVQLDIGGDVRIQGNLEITGNSTYITTYDLRVDDKTIELAYTTGTATDLFANDGGIVLHGTTDKTIKWFSGSNSWTSSETFNLSSGKTYKINGVDVLTSSTLASAITSAPGLTSFGNITTATLGQVIITTATIGVVNSTPLVIGTGNTTAVDLNGKRIQNLYTPTVFDTDDIAANKGYVDSAVSVARSGQFALTIDVSGQASGPEDPALNTFVTGLLEYLLPPTDPSPYGVADNSRARVLVTRTQTSADTAASNAIGFNSVSVYQAGTTNPINVVGYSANYVASTPIPSRTLTVNRAVKQYVVVSGAWTTYDVTPGSNTVYTDGTW